MAKRQQSNGNDSTLPPLLRERAARDRRAESVLRALLADQTTMAQIQAGLEEARRGVPAAPWRQLRSSTPEADTAEPPPYLRHAAALHERVREVVEGIYASEVTMAQIRDAIEEVERGVPAVPWRQVREEARLRAERTTGHRSEDAR